MKAVILAGGKGTRLAPYTTVFPKPLLPLGGIPVLETILRQLCHFGFTDVVLACGYLAELIEAYLTRNPISRKMRIRYHYEKEPLGTAGALRDIAGLEESFLAMNGDLLTDMNFAHLMQYHRQQQAALTIATVHKKVQVEVGVLKLDPQGNVTGYEEKPTLSFPGSSGIYVYDPRVLARMDVGAYVDVPTIVTRLIDAREKVLSYPLDAYWRDMGNRDDYEAAARDFEAERSRFLYDIPA